MRGRASEAHVFVVCKGQAKIGGIPQTQYQVSVYTYDEASKRYTFANVTPGGVSNSDLTLNGNTWAYHASFTGHDGETTYFRTLNVFDSPSSYRLTIQTSSDDVHWATTGSGTNTHEP